MSTASRWFRCHVQSNPHDLGRCETRYTAPSDGAKKGVVAYRKHRSASETRRGATAESEPKVLDDIIEPASAPRPRRHNTALKALREDAPAAQISAATEAARHDDEANRPTR